MRYIRYALLALLTIALVTVALANRNVVSLHLLPDSLAGILGMRNTLELPLFLVIFAGIVAGLLIGFVWEWFRELRLSSEASRVKRDVKKLAREVDRLKGGKGEPTDEVLALLENSGAKR